MPRSVDSNWQSGQAVVIVVVGMVIALTIGLSVAARSILNLQTTSEEEISQRAFSAAEAGIERALIDNESFSDVELENNATIRDVVVNPIDTNAQNQLLLNDGIPVLANDPIDVWLSNFPNYASPRSGTLNIYWGTAAGCSEAALEIVAITGTRASPSVARTVYDPCVARSAPPAGNYFSTPSAGATVAGAALQYGAALNITSGLLVRIVPLYQNTTVGVVASGGLDLPSQGFRIESVGQSGQTQRKITVYRGYPKIPYEIFPNVIFSL